MARYHATPKKLKTLLDAAGIKTQKEFAELVGVKEPTISRFDSQTRYDIDVLVSVSKALGMTIEELFIIEEVVDNNAEL